MRTDCLWSLRIAASLTVVRAIETVCIGAQRAFERYGEAVHISVPARILSLIMPHPCHWLLTQLPPL
jgi:hypothetical protein